MTCTICRHPQRPAIEQAISLQSLRNIAKRFGVNYVAVQRHKQAHLQPRLLRAAERREDLNADRLLQRLVGYLEEAEAGIEVAKRKADLVGLARLIKEARECAVRVGQATAGLWTERVTSVNIDNRIQIAGLRDMSADELRMMVGSLAALPTKTELEGEIAGV